MYVRAHSLLPPKFSAAPFPFGAVLGISAFLALGIFAVVPCDTSEESCISGPADPLRTLCPGSLGIFFGGETGYQGKEAALQVLTPTSN